MAKRVRRISEFLESYPIAKRSSFLVLLMAFTVPFTQPGWAHFAVLAVGAILTHRRTVTRMIMAAGALSAQHFSCFHRFFSQAAWDMEDVWREFVEELKLWLPPGVIELALDDTLQHRTGIRIFGAGLFYGHRNESAKSAPISRGNNWVVVGIVIPMPGWPNWYLFLPVAARLFVTKAECRQQGIAYQTRSELAAELITRTVQWLNCHKIVAVADGAYANRWIVEGLPWGVRLISRLAKNATLYTGIAAPEPHRPGPKPRFVKVGRLPKLTRMWDRLPDKPRRMPIPYPSRKGYLWFKSFTAYRPRVHRDQPILIIITRAAGGKEDYFFSTDIHQDPEEVIRLFARRWTIEVFFRNAKQHMGLEEMACRTQQAVERTGAFLFFMTGLVEHHFLTRATKEPNLLTPERPPWDRRARPPSFADMLSVVREELSNWMQLSNSHSKAKLKDRPQPPTNKRKRAA